MRARGRAIIKGMTAHDWLHDPTVNEPFRAERAAPRMLFDFSAMAACMSASRAPVLDFGAGSGWISELVARMGYDVVAYDIHEDIERCVQLRLDADRRLARNAITAVRGSGLRLPFANRHFGHVLCFDTLHHISDYAAIFREFARVLVAGGRAVFVEPGARHSSSAETIAFVAEQKRHDPAWIERDVVLEDISVIAAQAGFRAMRLVPLPSPLHLAAFDIKSWLSVWRRRLMLRSYARDLEKINCDERVIFYCDV